MSKSHTEAELSAVEGLSAQPVCQPLPPSRSPAERCLSPDDSGGARPRIPAV